jgi:KDO2-lipid IV(A) lauroyltransferase
VRKKIKHQLEYLFLKSFVELLNVLPWKALYLLAEVLARIIWALGIFHKTVFENLNRAFGKEKSREEIKRIAFQSYCNWIRNGCESCKYKISSERLKKMFTIEGKENLNKALAKGKGVIALVGHFGNFALMGARLAQEGTPFAFIMYGASLKKGAKLFKNMANCANLNIIHSLPRRVSAQKSLNWLRENKILGLHGDRDFPRGVFVDFFGHPAATAPGPIILAKRTGATILPMIAVREKNNKHRVIIDSPMELESTGDKQRDILVNVEKYTKILENYVKKYPEQWLWTYRRWKTKPPKRES